MLKKISELAKKNKLATAVILTLAVAVTVCVVLLCVHLLGPGDEPLTGDYTFIFGKEEVKYKNEQVVINGVLYVDMNRLASFAELSYSGSSSTMKYIASKGQYVKFTNGSEYAVVNGTKVEISAPAIVDEEKCIVPYSVISDMIVSGIGFRFKEGNVVEVIRPTYVEKDETKPVPITFSPEKFKSVMAIKDTSGVTFAYPDDVSAYLSSIDPIDPAPSLILVNASNPLDPSYEPSGLYKLPSGITALGESYYLKEDAALSLIAMMKTLSKYNVYVTSAYRDYNYQNRVFEQYVKSYTNAGYSREEAVAEVRKTSALPGTSEHQSGLCVDFMTDAISDLNNEFEATAAFEWLSENAYKYGFILRYPKDKTDITLYNYESWHFRYVGRDAATKIYFSDLCLEEYLELI